MRPAKRPAGGGEGAGGIQTCTEQNEKSFVREVDTNCPVAGRPFESEPRYSQRGFNKKEKRIVLFPQGLSTAWQ